MLKVCFKSTVGTVPHDARAFVFVSRHLSEVITATMHGMARLMIRQLLQSPWLHHGELQNFEPPLPTIFGRYLPESRAEQLLCSSTCTWLLEKCCFAGRENREKTRSLSQEVPTFIHSNKTQKVAPVRATHSQPSYRFQPLFYFFSSLWTSKSWIWIPVCKSSPFSILFLSNGQASKTSKDDSATAPIGVSQDCLPRQCDMSPVGTEARCVNVPKDKRTIS